jgi:prepilin-type N-terminal cleavage/methylation domain-containing protein
MRATQRGYTLLEIAVVLMIATLLLGGVLRGIEMVNQARIKDTIGDFSGVSSAQLAYYDRYKALPGDDAYAGIRWAQFSARSGNGDGLVSGNYNDPAPADPATMTIDATTGESLNFWWHLRLAGFLVGPSSAAAAAAPPTTSLGGIIGVQSAGAGLVGLISCTSNVPGKIAVGVEAMLDDLRPHVGAMRGMKQAAPNQALSAASPISEYAEDGASQYVLCKNA